MIAPVALPAAPIVRPCATRVESGLFVRGIPAFYRRRAIFASPLVLLAGEYATRPASDFRAVPGRPGRYYAQKLLVLVRARARVTLAVPASERRFALLYRPSDWKVPYSRGYRLSDGERAVTFRACRETEPSFVPRSKRLVGRWTEFNGGVVVAGAQCVTLLVRSRTGTRQTRVSFGAGRC